MTYRTAEQDERLSELYAERDAVQDYGIEHGVDVLHAVAALDAEIDSLTTGLDEAEQQAAEIQEVDEWLQPEDWREKRRQEWRGFLSRMNAPEMTEQRGTILTPYGWREYESPDRPLEEDEHQGWISDPGLY